MRFAGLAGLDVFWVMPAVVQLLWGATGLMLLVLLVSILLQRASAALRHRVWSLGIVAVLALPLLVAALPQWQLGWLEPWLPAPEPAVAAQTHTWPPSERKAVGRDGYAWEEKHAIQTMPTTHYEQFDSSASRPAEDEFDASSLVMEERAVSETEPVAGALWESSADSSSLWLAILFGVWAAGTVAGLLRILWSFCCIRRVLRQTQEIQDPACERIVQRLVKRIISIGRPAELLQSGETVSPICIGLWNCRIVLPANWRGWSEEELRSALTHELAHVSRRDMAWQLLASLACSLYWFHPLVWLAARRMRAEREIACDDMVINCGEHPARYARLLLHLAQQLADRTGTPCAGAVAMAGKSQVEGRIRSILTPDGRRTPLTRRAAWISAGLAVVLLTGVAVLSPLPPVNADADEQAPADEMDLQEAGKIPVMFRGRIKPLDTFARDSLRIISNNRESFTTVNGERQPAIRWLLDVITERPEAEMHPVFYIPHPEVLDTLELEPRNDDHYSLADLLPNIAKFEEQVEQPRELQRQGQTDQLSLYQRKLLELDRRIHRYTLVSASFRPLPFPEFPTEEDFRQDREQTTQTLMQIRRLMEAAPDAERQLMEMEPPLAVPPAEEDQQWAAYGPAWNRMYLQQALLSEESNPATASLAAVFDAYAEDDVSGFNRAVASYHQLLAELRPEPLNDQSADLPGEDEIRQAWQRREQFVESSANYLE
jgi:beta-lactamase regulating signal transducer with metallopeptidase domain